MSNIDFGASRSHSPNPRDRTGKSWIDRTVEIQPDKTCKIGRYQNFAARRQRDFTNLRISPFLKRPWRVSKIRIDSARSPRSEGRKHHRGKNGYWGKAHFTESSNSSMTS